MKKGFKLCIVAGFIAVILPAFVILAGQNTDCNCPGGDKPEICQDVACGDSVCDTACGEQITYPNMSGYCPGDCCSQIARCGNGVCETTCGENNTGCPTDCP